MPREKSQFSLLGAHLWLNGCTPYSMLEEIMPNKSQSKSKTPTQRRQMKEEIENAIVITIMAPTRPIRKQPWCVNRIGVK